MEHKYAKYLDNFCRAVQQEKDRLAAAKPVPPDQMEIVLDNDATEEEVEYYLKHYNPRTGEFED